MTTQAKSATPRRTLWSLLSALLFAGALSAGCAGTGSATLYVRAQPPPPRAVVVVQRPGQVWIEGRWFMAADGRWAWREGRWTRAQSNRVFVQGRWVRGNGGYRWVDGHWRVRGRYEHSPSYVRGPRYRR